MSRILDPATGFETGRTLESQVATIATLFLAILIASLGCANRGGKSEAQSKSNGLIIHGAPEVQKPDIFELAFIDSGSFDKQLSEALKHDNAKIQIVVPSSFDLNDIPPRMDRWLIRVQKSGGRVAAQPEADIGTRGAVGLILDITSVIADKITETMLYSPAGDYDALLLYDQEGEVSQIIFELRES